MTEEQKNSFEQMNEILNEFYEKVKPIIEAIQEVVNSVSEILVEVWNDVKKLFEKEILIARKKKKGKRIVYFFTKEKLFNLLKQKE